MPSISIGILALQVIFSSRLAASNVINFVVTVGWSSARARSKDPRNLFTPCFGCQLDI